MKERTEEFEPLAMLPTGNVVQCIATRTVKLSPPHHQLIDKQRKFQKETTERKGRETRCVLSLCNTPFKTARITIEAPEELQRITTRERIKSIDGPE